MYTHDDDMPTPEDQADALDSARTGICSAGNRAVVIYSLPRAPDDRKSGIGFECREYNAVDMSFAKYQEQHPGGWWGVAFSPQRTCGSRELAANVFYEMLAGNIPEDVDRVAVLPASRTRKPPAEMANMLAAKMIARIYDGVGITARQTVQPGLDVHDRSYFTGIPGAAALDAGVFPSYDARFTKDDMSRMLIRYMLALIAAKGPVSLPEFACLPADEIRALLQLALDEMSRRSFGTLERADIPDDMLEPVAPELSILYPKLGFDPSYRKLVDQAADLNDAWRHFSNACGLTRLPSMESGGQGDEKVPSVPHEIWELGRLSQEFSRQVMDIGRGRRLHGRGVGALIDMKLSEMKDKPAVMWLGDAEKAVPGLADLSEIPNVALPIFVDVGHVHDAYGTVRTQIPLACLDSLREKDGVYAMIQEGHAFAGEKMFAALLCGKFPKDARTVMLISANTASMRHIDRDRLQEGLAKIGATVVSDSSGVFARFPGTGRYCVSSYRQKAYFADDIPILPEYVEALVPGWEVELRRRGETALFGAGRFRSTTSAQLGRVLSEGRIEVEGEDIGGEPMRGQRQVFSAFSFLPVYHPLFETPDFVEQLVELTVIAGIWKAALFANGYAPHADFPAGSDLDVLGHLGRQQGIYPMVSAYYSGVPLEDIVGELAAAKIRENLIETMGYVAASRKAPPKM